MTARDGLIDGSKVPWDFVTRQSKGAETELPPSATRTPQQATRRRLIAAGRWRRP